MLPASVRGNLLDLQRVWLDADSPTSPSLPVPHHLQLVWQHGLPYWSDLNEQDFLHLGRFVSGVRQLLDYQPTHLNWIPYGAYLPDELEVVSDCGEEITEQEEEGRFEQINKGKIEEEPEIYPAFTLVSLPLSVRLNKPRYRHKHTPAQKNNHPPIVVQWPKEAGRQGLRDFMVEALIAEGIMAWPADNQVGRIEEPGIEFPERPGNNKRALKAKEEEEIILAVATAPWFGLNPTASAAQTPLSHPNAGRTRRAGTFRPQAILAAQPLAVRHVAIALAKLDFHLFV
jgi:hypothetical protein